MNFEISNINFCKDDFYKFSFKTKPIRRIIKVDNNVFFLSFPQMIYTLYFLKNNPLFQCRFPSYKTYSVNCAFLINEQQYLAPLYNTNDLSVCIGTNEFYKTHHSFENLQDNKNEIIIQFLQEFWSTEFNNDLNKNIYYYQDASKQIANYNWWQEKTKADPNWIPTEDLLIKIKS